MKAPTAQRLLERIHELAASETPTQAAGIGADAASEIFATDAAVIVSRGGRELGRSRGAEPADEPAPEASDRALRVKHRVARADLSVELVLEPEPGTTFDDEARALAEGWVRAIADVAAAIVLLEDARASARERREIVSIVSHDMRTPLQSVGLGVDAIGMLIKGTPLAATTSSTLARMQRSVGTMNRLLNDLLDVSRIHDGALAVNLSRCDGSTLVATLAEQHAPLAAARGFVFQSFAPAIGEVVCDASRLSQALSNLLANAVRHASTGPITLRATRTDDVIRFEVRDQGPGIPAEIRARLFDRLYQAGQQGGQRGGLGLGLYIAKGIAVAHGGRIGVDSEVGRGSTFWIDVPIRDRTLRAAEAATTRV